MLPLQEVWAQSLVRELGSYMLYNDAKKTPKNYFEPHLLYVSRCFIFYIFKNQTKKNKSNDAETPFHPSKK